MRTATITLTRRQVRYLQGVLEYEIERADHEPNYDPQDRRSLNILCDKVDKAAGASVGNW